jgi:hypothetical protein
MRAKIVVAAALRFQEQNRGHIVKYWTVSLFR